MVRSNVYTDLRGRPIFLGDLDDEERALLGRLMRRARRNADWNSFETYWTREVARLYDGRGVARTESVKSPLYRIAQDLGNRIGIKAGLVRPPDYRDELKELIRTQFRNRREFCKAAGISEDMLSHVLAGRKNLALETLEQALARIGWRLHILPTEPDTISR